MADTWLRGIHGLALLATASLSACLSDGMCVNTVASRQRSPDGRYDAVVFDRGCGATTGESSQVTLVRAGEAPPDAPGSILVAQHQTAVSVAWRTADTLEVSYGGEAEVLARTETASGVHISYVVR